jgi:D-alanyl-lipoteichoic acid acyltransferase DltB (MBOAT superfamily)
MIFSSNTFLFVFLPAAVCGFFAVGAVFGRNAGLAWLIACSLVFYGWGDSGLVPIIVVSVLVNYAVHWALIRWRAEPAITRWLLIGAIAVNLAYLGYFKYIDFGFGTLNEVAGTNFALWHVVLPIGISFFTLQQISFLTDVRRGKLNALDFLRYTVCVVFFPHLIAGPIVRYAEIYRQFSDNAVVRAVPKNILVGLVLVSIGLFKKVVMGDGLAVIVDDGYANYAELGFVQAWLVAFAFSFEIYFDFSGYSDMAIGMARIFNIRFPFNFDSPYRSLSIQEFWRRWHMTLSRFLRDYLYIPLGGGKRGGLITIRNVAIVFLLGGLWHGANWTFVMWGALQGIGVAAAVAWQRTGLRIPAPLSWAMAFLYMTLSWVFFRAPDFQIASAVLRAMFSAPSVAVPNTAYLVHVSLFILVALAMVPMRNSNSVAEMEDVAWPRLALTAACAAFALAFLGEGQPFIYFQF